MVVEYYFIFLLGFMLPQLLQKWVTSPLLKGKRSFSQESRLKESRKRCQSGNSLQISESDGDGVGWESSYQACKSWRVSC